MRTPPSHGGRQWVRPVVGDMLSFEQADLIDSPTCALPSVLVEATTPVPAYVPVPRFPVDSPTVAIARTSAPPVFVDESGRRRRWLAVAGASVVTVCAAYVAVVGVSVLHGSSSGGPVGDALAGLLPTAASQSADPAQDIADGADPATLPSVVPARHGGAVAAAPVQALAAVPVADKQSIAVTPQVASPPPKKTTTRAPKTRSSTPAAGTDKPSASTGATTTASSSAASATTGAEETPTDTTTG